MNQTSESEYLLTAKNLCKVYADGKVEALRDVSLDVAEGEFVSIMGPSGCGKSTLLNMLGSLDQPTSGQVLFRGQLVGSHRDLDQFRAREIGFVFQSYYLLPNLTAIENIQLPMFESELGPADREAKAQKLLEEVDLRDRSTHLPYQLSIGQRERVAIARALAADPALILADEPTGSLDSQSGREIMNLLSELNQQRATTLIIVTHDENVARQGQRLVKMLDGAVVEDTRLST